MAAPQRPGLGGSQRPLPHSGVELQQLHLDATSVSEWNCRLFRTGPGRDEGRLECLEVSMIKPS